MWRVLIADDEPKIRRGLRSGVDWPSFGMELVGEAEDGLEALELAESMRPDVVLVDICMPLLNGLEFIDKMQQFLADAIIVIVSGHNEFVYAQQALKLGVSDYLLKPVSKEQLYEVLEAAKERLLERKYIDWTARQVSSHMPQVKERFLNSWIDGALTAQEIREQLGYLQVALDSPFCVVLIKVLDRIRRNEGNPREWDRRLLLFAVQNVAEDVVRQRGAGFVFADRSDHIIVISAEACPGEGVDIGAAIASAVEAYLKITVIALYRDGIGDVAQAPLAYRELLQAAAEESRATPIVVLAKKYIRDHYHKEDLTLKDVADVFNMSPSYLSRLLRQETGASFIDYLTETRIKQAALLLLDPTIKIVEVASRVGYNGQHYFSMAFKKQMGVSPAEYRKGGVR
ncbi:hypothetical protein SD70_26425 [Gordoniibacillus kamchatkensis]|uniref:DNA-binding response regulator n=1 Tax=Gordoniibacillus kamchatkensis TaxID=1590651 RepID=A0ABR5ACP5_9BACL|nr:response regulator [Paenibacillus sp. VKM B-2647]KIL38448.1 hypothetical protein SD70_26425 [Paenibacillus sp. VKM B-2647]